MTPSSLEVYMFDFTGDLETSGDVRINGQKIQMKYMRRISGYVYQDDLFIPTLTVSEHMHLAVIKKWNNW